MSETTWTPYSWQAPDKVLAQVPEYPDPEALERVERQLKLLPPLLFAGEARQLKEKLARVARGDAFVLQGGDCAESFTPMTRDNQAETHGDYIRDMLKVLLQMSVVLTFGAQKHIVKIGRLAGQYAKPRSRSTERRGDVVLPSYRGDIINGVDFTPEARIPDPNRMLEAYTRSAATLNLLRGFTKGGYADLRKVHKWNMAFLEDTAESHRYSEIADHIQEALSFIEACGVDIADKVRTVDLYTSHEALLLAYDAALTRQDSSFGPHHGQWYACSAHFLWVGNRTRDLNSAHIEYLRGIQNPIGLKVGPGMAPAELLDLLDALDPDHEPGRITLISRFGADRIAAELPALVEAARDSRHPVIWICDAMHGNTQVSEVDGVPYKTRSFDNVLAEIEQFFSVHEELGTWPGGVHLELTGHDVTECVGGHDGPADHHLPKRYYTQCDPRLNARQSLELAFRVAEMLKARRNGKR